MSFLGGESEYVKEFITPGSLVIDIGAHHGMFSVFALELGAYVVAIEPHSDNVVVLRENLSSWTGHHTVFQAAIGHEHGTCSLEVPGGETSGSYCIPGFGIEVIGWSWLQKSFGSVDVLKIDIEGGEYDLFPSCEVSWVPTFVIEIHDWTVADEPAREDVGMRSSGPRNRSGAYDDLVEFLERTHELEIVGGRHGGFIVGRRR